MYGSALPMGIGFFLLFFPPVLSELALFCWLLVFSILIRIAMTLYSVPHMALGAEMTNDYRQRTTLVAGRTAFGFLGTLTVYVLGFGWFFAASERFPNGQLNAAAYPQLAGILAVLMVASTIESDRSIGPQEEQRRIAEVDCACARSRFGGTKRETGIVKIGLSGSNIATYAEPEPALEMAPCRSSTRSVLPSQGTFLNTETGETTHVFSNNAALRR